MTKLKFSTLIAAALFSANCHILAVKGKEESAGTTQAVITNSGCSFWPGKTSKASAQICEGGPVSAINVHSMIGCALLNTQYRVEFTCASGKKQVSYVDPVEAERLQRLSQEPRPAQCEISRAN